MTEWRPVLGWEERYEVSNSGLVRKRGGQEIGQWASKAGYMHVRLSKPRAQLMVHRIVAGAFLGPPKAKLVVNHIDNNPANNSVQNLEWCTQAENLQHAANQGRLIGRYYWRGKRTPVAKLSDAQVRQLRRERAINGTSYQKLGQMFGISKQAAGRCVSGETYADVLPQPPKDTP